ncbi:S-layer homology domain-containing protein [Cytobacillus gottheilii]|uniref:S-layer homology domain-containing protein n=1 Tax=Cytobacillus gottheilii TaxID=859144 RepID=A0ABX8FA72_9BACI|nr:S-layer homology domain-containing protein [Cytobacillus gottheilii]QVY61280.1 S-layer homology domain-containing protein [Cytobacillus gottheilii]
MSKTFKKLFSCMLAFLLIFPTLQPTFTLASEMGNNEITEAMWLTELYINDIPRNENYTGLSGSTIDSMDYIEVYNSSDSELDFGSNFDLVYSDTSDKTLTFIEEELIIPAKSAAVFWVKRVDLESKGTMPDEAAFRESLNIPDEVPVFSVNNQKALKNPAATVSIVGKSTNEPVSTYTYDLTDVGSEQGTSVHLQAVEGTSDSRAIAKQAAPSAGIVSEMQENVSAKAILTSGSISRTSEKNATVTFTSNKSGSYYYAVVNDGADAPIIDTTGEGTPIVENVDTPISLTSLTADPQDLYVVVKDETNNLSNLLKIDIPHYNSNNEVFLTEVYPNDIARNDVYTGLSGATIDSMDYIEVYNASDSELDFGTNFNLIYTDSTLTFNEEEVKIPAESTAIFWIRRVDLEKSGKTMPNEAAFRESLNIPNDVPVFSVNNQKALKNPGGTVSIVAKSTNETVSSYTYDLSDVGSAEGTSVHLLALEGTPDSLAIEKQATPSAGSVREVQKNYFTKAILTPGSEIRSSDSEANVSFTSNKSGSYYYAVVDDGADAPSIDTTGEGTPIIENVETKIELSNLKAGAHDLYVVVKDETNNISDALKIDIPLFVSNTNVFLTEIYPNDIARNEVYTGLSSTSIDSMDFIEVYNASDSEMDFGTNFNLVYTDGSEKLLTFTEEEVKIPAESTAVFWMRRVDLENKGKTMPDEADFRESLNIPNDVPVFSVNNQTAMRNTTATVAIVAKASNETISTFTYNRTDAGAKEGSSVHLQSAEGIAQSVSIATQANHTAGLVSEIQKTPLIDLGIKPEISKLEENPQDNLIEEGTDLSIPYAYNESTDINSFVVYYRTNKSDDWTAQASNSFNTRVPGKYYVEIGADRYLNSEYIEYYVEANNTFHTTNTPIHRVSVVHSNEFTGKIRSNLSDNEVVSGTVNIIGRSQDDANVDIKVDGNLMENTRMLEQGVYFTLDIEGLDGRKNALLANGELVQTFSRWYDVMPSRAVKIDSSFFTFNENGDAEVKIRILAGTEIDAMDISPGTASDNFNMTNFALEIPGGTTLYPIGDVKSTDAITLNKNKRELELQFTIPQELMNANSTNWDTNSVSDGAHTISISNPDGASKEFTVNVDNLGPEIIADVPAQIDGTYTFAADYQDASAVVNDTLSLELDGTLLDGTSFNGSELSLGTHTLKATIQDELGNVGTKTWTFTSSVNYPVFSDVSSTGANHDASTLTAALSKGVDADVSFHDAKALTVDNGITVYEGTGDDTNRSQLGKLGEITSENGSLPYQIYELDVNDADTSLRFALNATTDYGKDVRLYVSNKLTNEWELLDSKYEDSIVTAVFETANFIKDGKVYVLAQGRGMEMLPSQKDSGPSTVKNNYLWDGTGEPEQYDFSFAWTSDTQYYSQSYPNNFELMNNHIVANKDRKDIRYVIHTGDLIDDIDETYQWEYADKYMKILEDANLPYGVLAGNHDIANHNRRYENYQTYFGADRFEGNDVYGDSYKNNLGHYDLVTAGGQDFILVYMSYDFDQEAAAWINKVLAEHSDRFAILNFHNYINRDGELDAAGQYFQKEVVAKNPNVKLVLGGHYHGAAINVSGFDDDNDGIEERKVYQLLTNYQSGEEGGNAYYKMLYFDLANGKIYMNSYSPKLNDFNLFDAPKLNSYDIGVQASSQDIFELDLDFDVNAKSLTVDSVDAVLFSNSAIDEVPAEDASASILAENVSSKTYDKWIAIAENNSGKAYSELVSFNTKDGNDSTGNTGGGSGGNPNHSPAIENTVSGDINHIRLQLNANNSLENVKATIDDATASKLLTAVKDAEAAGRAAVVEIVLNGNTSATSVDVTIPQYLFTQLAENDNVQLKVDAGVSIVTFDVKALNAIHSSSSNEKNVQVSMVKSDSAEMSQDMKTQLDGRPIYDISVNAGDTTISGLNGGNALISIPYTLLPNEDPNAVVIYKIIDNNELQNVIGKYNPETKSVEFTTTQFTSYSIGYNKVSFKDVRTTAWYYDPVTYIAAHGITDGTGNGKFSPDAKLTRGQFLVMLLRSYGIDVDDTVTDNFVDAGNTYYTDYLATAKKLGITNGIDGKKFAPGRQITRQDMFTLIYRTLAFLEKLPEPTTNKTLSDYADAGQVSDHAKEAVNHLIEAGIIVGNKGKMNPLDRTTRSELSKVLYNLLTR